MLFSMPMSAMKVKLSTIIDFIFTCCTREGSNKVHQGASRHSSISCSWFTCKTPHTIHVHDSISHLHGCEQCAGSMHECVS